MLIVRYYIQIYDIISFLKNASEEQKAYLLLTYNTYVYNLINESSFAEFLAIQKTFQNPYSNPDLSLSLFAFHYLEAEKIQEFSKNLAQKSVGSPESLIHLNMTDQAGIYSSKILSSIYGSIFPLSSKKKITYILRDLMPTSEKALNKVFSYQEDVRHSVEKILGPGQNQNSMQHNLFNAEEIGERLVHFTSPILPDFLKY